MYVIAYDLRCEFDITRRIGWSDEDLGEHIDAVFDRMHQAQGVLSLDANADLDTGRANIAVRFETLTSDDPRHLGCAMVGVAIRSNGASHEGLLPLREEAVVGPDRGHWSGLRTPTWKVRQIAMTEVRTGS